MALSIHKKTHDIEQESIAWSNHLAAEKMWTNLKLHLAHAYEELHDICDATMCSTAYHQANMNDKYDSPKYEVLQVANELHTLHDTNGMSTSKTLHPNMLSKMRTRNYVSRLSSLCQLQVMQMLHLAV